MSIEDIQGDTPYAIRNTQLE